MRAVLLSLTWPDRGMIPPATLVPATQQQARKAVETRPPQTLIAAGSHIPRFYSHSVPILTGQLPCTRVLTFPSDDLSPLMLKQGCLHMRRRIPALQSFPKH